MWFDNVLCACGLPIVTYSFADNQIPGIRKFAEKGVAFNCGDLRVEFEKTFNNIITHIEKLNKDYFLRKQKIKLVSEVMDRNGAFRIFSEIKK